MEHSPSDPESGSDSKESSKKSKKKAEAIGAILVEPKKEKEPKAEKRSAWLKDLKPEAVEKSEAHAAEETIAKDEKPYAVESIIQAHQVADAEATVEAPLVNEEAEAQAAVERFRNRITEDHMEPETAMEVTLDEIASLQPEAEAEEPLESESDPEGLQEFGDDDVLELTHDDSDRQESDTPASSGPANSSSLPPPSLPPTGAGHVAGSFFGPHPSSYASAVAPRVEKEYVPVYNRSDMFGAAVAGGIVGYLIGRRRGRIKTEKKLLPVQKKLQKQVENLQTDIASKELTIRKAAREKARERQMVAAVPVVAERLQRKATEQAKNAAEVPIVQDRRERAAAPEAHALHGNKSSREQIGKVLLSAETSTPNIRPENSKPTGDQERALVERQTETMSRAELLAVSEKIVVDGSSLRQIYETHLVGERGLRRLVAEHLRGGNVKKALRREMVEREIDFERDPAMRDRPGVAAMGATTKTTLNGLLQQAEAGLERGQSEEVAFLKARAAYETEEQDRQRQQRKRIDIALTGTIALLAVLIALLVFRGN